MNEYPAETARNRHERRGTKSPERIHPALSEGTPGARPGMEPAILAEKGYGPDRAGPIRRGSDGRLTAAAIHAGRHNLPEKSRFLPKPTPTKRHNERQVKQLENRRNQRTQRHDCI